MDVNAAAVEIEPVYTGARVINTLLFNSDMRWNDEREDFDYPAVDGQPCSAAEYRIL